MVTRGNMKSQLEYLKDSRNRLIWQGRIMDEDSMVKLATALSPCLRQGDILLLNGDLGAGKTAFSRALIRQMCKDLAMDVPSPTFTLVQLYDIDAKTLWHFDLYRLGDPEDVFELGWEDAVDDGIVLVEWPQRLDTLCPDDALEISISWPVELGETVRDIAFSGDAVWQDRIQPLVKTFAPAK